MAIVRHASARGNQASKQGEKEDVSPCHRTASSFADAHCIASADSLHVDVCCDDLVPRHSRRPLQRSVARRVARDSRESRRFVRGGRDDEGHRPRHRGISRASRLDLVRSNDPSSRSDPGRRFAPRAIASRRHIERQSRRLARPPRARRSRANANHARASLERRRRASPRVADDNARGPAHSAHEDASPDRLGDATRRERSRSMAHAHVCSSARSIEAPYGSPVPQLGALQRERPREETIGPDTVVSKSCATRGARRSRDVLAERGSTARRVLSARCTGIACD